MKNLDQIKTFVKTFVNEVWCERNKEKVEQYYDKSFIGFLNSSESFNYEDVLRRIDYSKANFEKNTAEFHDVFIVADNLIGARLSMHRTDQQKSEKVVPILLVLQLQDEKIQRLWLFTDLNYRYKN